MGGFHLFERSSKEASDDDRCILRDDKPLYPLDANDLLHYSESIIMPTEEEIKDKGKSDWLAKSLVLLQTSWFVLQCISRAIRHLPITHLEIITLAYAAMNFVIYIFWWNKPLNVNRPIRVLRKSEPSETQRHVTEPILEGWKLTWEAIGSGLELVFKFIAGGQDDGVDLSREDRVPRFWADSDENDAAIADVIVLGVGICFGAIHCIAWGFSFPTHAELSVWRISSIAITAVPIYVPLVIGLGVWVDHMNFDTAAGIVGVIILISGLPAGILYIIARVVTLVLAFTSLRDLPPGAFDTIHWTTFIPHV